MNTTQLVVDVPPQNPATGVYKTTSKPITEGQPVSVAENTNKGNFWDGLSALTDENAVGDLLQTYLKAKITKEVNPPVTQSYTTMGNPADQPGGALLSDTAQGAATRNTLLWVGLGTLTLIAVVYVATRK